MTDWHRLVVNVRVGVRRVAAAASASTSATGSATAASATPGPACTGNHRDGHGHGASGAAATFHWQCILGLPLAVSALALATTSGRLRINLTARGSRLEPSTELTLRLLSSGMVTGRRTAGSLPLAVFTSGASHSQRHFVDSSERRRRVEPSTTKRLLAT